MTTLNERSERTRDSWPAGSHPKEMGLQACTCHFERAQLTVGEGWVRVVTDPGCAFHWMWR